MANENVLVLEDDLASLNLVSKQLTAAGYRVIPVVDGRMAIETCRSSPPDLVVCDLSMPGMDGFEFIRRLRQERMCFFRSRWIGSCWYPRRRRR